MGRIRFLVHHRERISDKALNSIYMAGFDDLPWVTEVFWDGEHLCVERFESESGYVHVPWQLNETDCWYLATSTLLERDRPYLLEVELARGLFHRLRVQTAGWSAAGLELSAEFQQGLQEASHLFFRAAACQQEIARSAGLAEEAIVRGMELSRSVSADLAGLVAPIRLKAGARSLSFAGVMGRSLPAVEATQDIHKVMDIAIVPAAWIEIEAEEGNRNWQTPDKHFQWATNAGLRVGVGPLLSFAPGAIPDWMYLWEDDDDSVLAFMLDHVRETVSRYAGKVQFWHVASSLNTGGALSLDGERRIRIVAESIALVRQIDPKVPIIASFDQPWAEYLSDEDDVAPLQYADTLVRSDVGLDGIGLVIENGFPQLPQGLRSPLAVSRLVDQWSLLGVPLAIFLSAPSHNDAPPPEVAATPSPDSAAEATVGVDPQLYFSTEVLPLLVAKQNVQVIAWQPMTCSGTNDPQSQAGWLTAEGISKPAWRRFREYRLKYQ